MSLSSLPDKIPREGELVADKYRIERVLGEGAMGIVVSARHCELNQRVAIKFLSPSLLSHPKVVSRFLREARAAAGIHSEHVARVHDVARLENGVPYIVMEHLSGNDLQELLDQRRTLPVGEAIDYLLQACEAIAEAHARGIVHRDLKPSNMFVSRRADGSTLVKVLDFGISKITDAAGAKPLESSLTNSIGLLGTPYYVSPEQAMSAKTVDHRTDIWALGIILYEMLTAEPAFLGNTVAAYMNRILTDPPIPMRTHRPELPKELDAIVMRCLEKDLKSRIQDLGELARALEPFALESSRVSIKRIVSVIEGAKEELKDTVPREKVLPSVEEPSPEPSKVTEEPATVREGRGAVKRDSDASPPSPQASKAENEEPLPPIEKSKEEAKDLAPSPERSEQKKRSKAPIIAVVALMLGVLITLLVKILFG